VNSVKVNKLGVVLFQLGGPDSLEAVEPFLYNLFCDPDIIDFPFARLARGPLARLVSSRRARRVQDHYAQIGGKSPIRELTELQASGLESELRKTLEARVFVAMRYWHPLTEEAVHQVLDHQIRTLVLLPLYPQYSVVTTGSSLNEWERKFPRRHPVDVRVVRDYHAHPVYIEALVERVNEGLEEFRKTNGSALRLPSNVHLLFSAHGVPESVIKAGDPYQAQIEATVGLVRELGAWPNPHSICYQSRSGPGRWLGPSLLEALQSLASTRGERVLVVPISFVSDHVETLYEINIEAREIAERLCIQQFHVTRGLNDSPTFIRALADLVLHAVGRENSL
jgi:protoporphyrin/coproporphyrin ferrochelatase